MTFTRNRKKGDKRVSTNISQVLQGAGEDNPVVRSRDSPFLGHTGSIMAPAYFVSHHLPQSVVILSNCTPICNLSPPLDRWLSNFSAHQNPLEGLLKTQITGPYPQSFWSRRSGNVVGDSGFQHPFREVVVMIMAGWGVTLIFWSGPQNLHF